MMKKVVVIGGGFVGLQEAILFAKNGFDVLIIDVDPFVVKHINSGQPHLSEKYVVENWNKVRDRIAASTSYSSIQEADIVVIAVNTPVKVYGGALVKGLLNETEIDYFIDFSPLETAVKELVRYLWSGTYINSLVTIYPSGTQERIIKHLDEAGFVVGRDVYVTHTPERIDPGSTRYNPENIPRNIGYLDEASLRIGLEVYKRLGIKLYPEKMHLVELSKLHENAFRLVNIAFVQESLAKFGEDIIKVIDLASTKPFGFMRFYPSPYAGGTCLVKDSIMYWYATKNELVKQALIINEQMPRKYAELLYVKIKEKGYKRILFYGLGYKPGSPHYIKKELNPIERLVEELRSIDPSLEVKKFDPNIPQHSDFKDEKEAKEWADIVIYWDYKRLLEV